MILLFDIDYTLFDTDVFKKSNLTTYNLYLDTYNILKKLSKSHALGILSQGEKEFQLKKLKETKIHGLFNEHLTFIISDKLESLPEIMDKFTHEKVAFIEDKIHMLEAAKKLNPNLMTVWFKNGPFAEKTESTFTPDKTIHSLKELQDLFL